MLAPIVPSPIKPTFMPLSRIGVALPRIRGRGPFATTVSRLPLREDVLGDLRRRHCRRPAGVKGEMRDDLADLLLGDAIVERAVEMARQLPFAAEGDQRRDNDEAAVALFQARALPNFAEQPLLAVIDQVGNDIPDRLARRVHFL